MASKWRTALAAGLAAAFVALGGGCTGEGYTSKEFTADDHCRGCEGGGLFSGEDGRFTIVGGTAKKKLPEDERE